MSASSNAYNRCGINSVYTGRFGRSPLQMEMPMTAKTHHKLRDIERNPLPNGLRVVTEAMQARA